MFPPANSPTPTFPYRIEATVGSGAMGVVFRATEVALARRVAIKSLRPLVVEEESLDGQRDLRARFLQEARAQAALAHPGVTTVYSVGEEGGYPYMVMEWLEGETLAAVMTAHEKLSPPVAVRYAVELLDALDTAHRCGVVHRDIKPSNLLIQRHDGRLKVMDFGIALVRQDLTPAKIASVETQVGVVLATPRFAAPEQLDGLEVDGRCDLFSTGVVLYYLLTGVYPFRGNGFMSLVNAVLLDDQEPVRHLEPGVPAVVEAVIQKALRKERGARFGTAREMAAPLRAYLAEVGESPAKPERDSSDEATLWRMPSRRGLPTDPGLMIARLVEGWPSRALPRQSTYGLLDRLLERPVHAAPFAGAVQVGDACLFFHDGVLLGAVDASTGASGDGVAEGLPALSAAQLHPVPKSLPLRIMPLLTSVLHPPRLRHGELDSSFVDLPALAEQLKREQFEGLFRFRHGQALGLTLFDRGQAVLNLYSDGWQGVALDQSWQQWISTIPVRAQVEEKVVRPLMHWYRRAFRDVAFEVAFQQDDNAATGDEDASAMQRSGSSLVRQLLRISPSGRHQARLALRFASTAPLPEPMPAATYEQDPAFRFLRYLLESLPAYMHERKLVRAWKYLVDWIALVRRATLHRAVPRPGSGETDAFDVVTEDDQGKVLHVAQWMAHGTEARLDRFLARVERAKAARDRSGDIGGAFVVAPTFDEEALRAYRARVTDRGARRWFGVEEALTGYQGYVRTGARRGFHLMLIEARDDGFAPILPGG